MLPNSFSIICLRPTHSYILHTICQQLPTAYQHSGIVNKCNKRLRWEHLAGRGSVKYSLMCGLVMRCFEEGCFCSHERLEESCPCRTGETAHSHVAAAPISYAQAQRPRRTQTNPVTPKDDRLICWSLSHPSCIIHLVQSQLE